MFSRCWLGVHKMLISESWVCVSACYALLGEYIYRWWRKAVYIHVMLHTPAWDWHTSTKLWLTKNHYFAAQTSAKLSFFYWCCITFWYLDLGIYVDADTRLENGRKKCRRPPPDSQRSTVSDVTRARVAHDVACPDAAQLRMSARPISASPTSVGSRRRLRSAFCDDLGLVGRRTQLPLSGRPCLSCCHTSCLEQPAGGGAVVHIVPAVLTSSQGWLFRRPLGPCTPRDLSNCNVTL